RRHTRWPRDWSSDVCSSDLIAGALAAGALIGLAFIAGPGAVLHRLVHPRLYWLPIAFVATIASYLGYMLAYRQCANAGAGPDLRSEERRVGKGWRCWWAWGE